LTKAANMIFAAFCFIEISYPACATESIYCFMKIFMILWISFYIRADIDQAVGQEEYYAYTESLDDHYFIADRNMGATT